jgi:hypothetical protein
LSGSPPGCISGGSDPISALGRSAANSKAAKTKATQNEQVLPEQYVNIARISEQATAAIEPKSTRLLYHAFELLDYRNGGMKDQEGGAASASNKSAPVFSPCLLADKLPSLLLFSCSIDESV